MKFFSATGCVSNGVGHLLSALGDLSTDFQPLSYFCVIFNVFFFMFQVREGLRGAFKKFKANSVGAKETSVTDPTNVSAMCVIYTSRFF